MNEDTAHAALHECLCPGSATIKACPGKKIPPELRKEIFGKKKGTPDVVEPDAEPEPNGYMQPHAAKVLMKIVYGARMARFDLLRAISYLASSVTKWTKQCDEDLYRLICYIHTTRDYRQVAWVGDDIKDVKLRLYADADFSGCVRTQRSTSGAYLFVIGQHTRFLLGGSSRRQTAVSHSTTEAELIAAEYALRAEGLPVLSLWNYILGRDMSMEFAEDNEAMIQICTSNQMAKMRHVSRTHRINLASVGEKFNDPAIDLYAVCTDDQAGDIHTKRFTDAPKWHQQLYLNNVVLRPEFHKAPDLESYLRASLAGCSFFRQRGGLASPLPQI